jgi:hypothetical protein
MTESSEKDLTELLREIVTLASDKYRAGSEEHGGDLADVPVGDLLNEAIQENIDSLFYLLTAKRKLNGYKQFMGSQKASTGNK